ncbi:MAG TPA: heparan-alpha-glucosaminide N-acetyltransferase domain-containing protein [Candidatus Limnocylindrales bacterium]|nr:heparan-alpha-glucosaminide N-acetyltransferase domain-containing protein [Candidatus Limnocylindrales bacterium]
MPDISDRPPPAIRTDRLLPIDWARGLAMILMAVDHASAMLNHGRVVPGSRNLNGGATSFPVDQFFLRWSTHICPVAFVSLAGVSMFLSIRRKTERGESAAAIDRFLVSRGLFIVLIDFVWLNASDLWKSFGLDVLTAIGAGIASMALLRRLPRAVLAIVGLGLVLTPELGGLDVPKGLAAALYNGGRASPHVFLDYPVLPWIGVMALGWCWAGYALGEAATTERIGRAAARTLVPLVVVAFVLRGLNGFGNALAPRLDGSLQQWLDLSKNPPSLAFLAFELGVLGMLLVGFAAAAARGAMLRPLAIFGQTALFFYALHFYVMGIAVELTGLGHAFGIPGALASAALLVAAMYPLCRWYAGYKARHDNLVTRYV